MDIRTDSHRPAEFNPEDYEFLMAFDNGDSEDQPNLGITFDNGEEHDLNELLENLFAAGAAGRVPYGDATRCDHCGARIRYVGLVRHLPTGDIIAVGETCLFGRMTYSKAEFDYLRKNAQLDRAAQKVLAQWNQFKTNRPDVEWDVLAESPNEFIADVLRRGRNYGTLSDRQVEAIVTAHARDKQYAEEKAAREANALPPIAVPTGNGIAIEGTVISTKWVENDFGGALKMLVEVEQNGGTYKVWGTVPSAIRPDSGDRVRFVANLEQSRDDECFGFFKRPRKAEVLEVVAA